MLKSQARPPAFCPPWKKKERNSGKLHSIMPVSCDNCCPIRLHVFHPFVRPFSGFCESFQCRSHFPLTFLLSVWYSLCFMQSKKSKPPQPTPQGIYCSFSLTGLVEDGLCVVETLSGRMVFSLMTASFEFAPEARGGALLLFLDLEVLLGPGVPSLTNMPWSVVLRK